MSVRSPSGRQFRLRHGAYAADVASAGATLRTLSFDGRDLVAPFDADQARPEMRGALLAPWPNRIADGRYGFGGVTHQLPLNEPARGNAAHGLAAWEDFAPDEIAADRVRLTGAVQARPGYPWRLRLDVDFVLDGAGLTQRVTATNESAEPAPVGIGGHPYLRAGDGGARAADAWSIEIPADDVLLTSADRLLPTTLVGVGDHAGGALDFRVARTVGATAINHAFTSLRRDADGFARVALRDATGAGVEIAWDGCCDWVQVYTADESPGDGRRSSIAVEPMTCPPDAFNSKRSLITLAPGAATTVAWTIRALG